MDQCLPLIDENGEVRELTDPDMRLFKPADEVLAPSLRKAPGMRVRGRKVRRLERSRSRGLGPRLVTALSFE